MISEFNKSNLRVLHGEINSALAEIGAKYGISLSIGHGSFSHSKFTARLTGLCVDQTTGTLKNRLNESMFRAIGLDPKYLKYTEEYFNGNGVKMMISDIKLKNPKNPIMLTGQNGKSYSCSVNTLVHTLSKLEANTSAPGQTNGIPKSSKNIEMYCLMFRLPNGSTVRKVHKKPVDMYPPNILKGMITNHLKTLPSGSVLINN